MEAKIIEVTTQGIVSFKIREDSSGYPWFYNLEIGGEPAYLICELCETCYSLFERLRDVELPLTPAELSAALARGIDSITPEIEHTVSALLPPGKYIAAVIEVNAALRRSGQEVDGKPVNYATDYFWEHRVAEGSLDWIGFQPIPYIQDECVYPLTAEPALKPERVREYEQMILLGEGPTALAVSMVDVHTGMGSRVWWRLAHFLLDGHHKMMAYSNLGMPARILSFLSVKESNAPVEENEYIRKHYGMGELPKYKPLWLADSR